VFGERGGGNAVARPARVRLGAGMMRVFWMGCLLGASVAAADAGFSERLSESDFKAAGLDKLTPEERARLDELVAAEPRGASASGRVVRSGEPATPPVTRGKIAGRLTGWKEGTVLTFEDGSRWQIVSKGSYRAAPVRNSPKVELVPLVNGDFVMTVDTVPRRAEVRRIAE